MKMSTRNKTLLVVAVVVILALLGAAVVYAVGSGSKRTVLAADAIVKVDRGDLTSIHPATATVASGRQGQFKILDGVKVESVLVRVGDTVKKGDLLATFDAEGLDEMLRVKKRDFETAQRTYRDYMAGAAGGQSSSGKARIAELEAKIASQAGGDAVAKAPQNTQLDSIKNAISGLLGNTRLGNRIVDTVFAENGTVAKTVAFFQNLLGGGLFGGLSNMLGGFNMNSMIDSMGMGDSLELMQLKLQDAFSGLSAGMSLDNLYKSMADSAENAYRQTEQAAALLKEGWTAEYDGIIREVNITEGEIYKEAAGQSPAASGIDVTSLLTGLMGGGGDIGSMLGGLFSNQTSGMVVEYYPFTASFLLGKYDIAKVSLDQQVEVTSVTGKRFDAFVSFISPVAQESSDINISSLMGAGGSARGVEARITIPQPDKSITIGLDVDVTIELETKRDVLRVPVESVAIDEETGGFYVYVLERVSRTVKRQPVKTGLFDGNAFYEITDGLKEGTEIVRAPQKSLEDGQKVKLG